MRCHRTSSRYLSSSSRHLTVPLEPGVMASVPIELELVSEQLHATDIYCLPYYKCLFSPYVISELLPQPPQPFLFSPVYEHPVDADLFGKSLHSLVDDSVHLVSAAESPLLRSLQTIFSDLAVEDIAHTTSFISSASRVNDDNHAQVDHIGALTLTASPGASTGYAFIPRVEQTYTSYPSQPTLGQQRPSASSCAEVKLIGTLKMEGEGSDACLRGGDATECPISNPIPQENIQRPRNSCNFPDPVYIPPERITPWLAASLGLSAEAISSVTNTGMGIHSLGRCTRTPYRNHANHIISRAFTWLQRLHTHIPSKRQHYHTCISENRVSNNTTINTRLGTGSGTPSAHSSASGQMANTDRCIEKGKSTDIQLIFPYITQHIPGISEVLYHSRNFPTLSHISGDGLPDIEKIVPTSHDLMTFLSHASHMAIYHCSTHATPPLHPIKWILSALSLTIANVSLTTDRMMHKIKKNSSLPDASVRASASEYSEGKPHLPPPFLLPYMRHAAQSLQDTLNTLYPTSQRHMQGSQAINNAKIRIHVDSSHVSVSVSLNMEDQHKDNEICRDKTECTGSNTPPSKALSQRRCGETISTPAPVPVPAPTPVSVSLPGSVPLSPLLASPVLESLSLPLSLTPSSLPQSSKILPPSAAVAVEASGDSVSTADAVTTHVGDKHLGICAKSLYLGCIRRQYASRQPCASEANASITNNITYKHTDEPNIADEHVYDIICNPTATSSPTRLNKVWQGIAEREVEREERQYQQVLADEMRVAMEQREILMRERMRLLCSDSDSGTSSDDSSSDSDNDNDSSSGSDHDSDVESDEDVVSDVDCCHEENRAIDNTTIVEDSLDTHEQFQHHSTTPYSKASARAGSSLTQGNAALNTSIDADDDEDVSMQSSSVCSNNGNAEERSLQSPLAFRGRVPGATPNWGHDIALYTHHASSLDSRTQTDSMPLIADVHPESGCLSRGRRAGSEARECVGGLNTHICEITPDFCLHGSVVWVSDTPRPCFYKETQDIMPTADINTTTNTDSGTMNRHDTCLPVTIGDRDEDAMSTVGGRAANATSINNNKDNEGVLMHHGWEAWGARMLKAHWRYVTRIMPWSPQFQKETPDAASRYLPSSLRYFKVVHPDFPLFSRKSHFRVGSPVPFPSLLTPKTLSFPTMLPRTSRLDAGGANTGTGTPAGPFTYHYQEVGRERLEDEGEEREEVARRVFVHLHPHTWLHPQFVAASAAIPQAPKLLWWLTGALSRACIRATPGKLTGNHAFTRVPLAEYGYEPGCDFASSFPTIASPYRTVVGLLAALHTLYDAQAVGSLGIPYPANMLVWMAALAHIIQVGLTYTIETVCFDEFRNKNPEYVSPGRKEGTSDNPDSGMRDAYGLYPHSSRQACALITWYMHEQGLIKTKVPVLASISPSTSTPAPTPTPTPTASPMAEREPVRMSSSTSALERSPGLRHPSGPALSRLSPAHPDSDHIARYTEVQSSYDTAGTSRGACVDGRAYPHIDHNHSLCDHHYCHCHTGSGFCDPMDAYMIKGDACCSRWEAFARAWLHRTQSTIRHSIMTHVCAHARSPQSSTVTTSTGLSVPASPSHATNTTTAQYSSLVHAALRQHHESWTIVAAAVVDTVVRAIDNHDVCLQGNIDTYIRTRADISTAPIASFLADIDSSDANTSASALTPHSTHAHAMSPHISPRHLLLPTDSRGAQLPVLTPPQLSEVWYLSASPVDIRLALARLASQMRIAEALGYRDDVLGAWTLLNEGWRDKAHEWGRCILMHLGVISYDDDQGM